VDELRLYQHDTVLRSFLVADGHDMVAEQPPGEPLEVTRVTLERCRRTRASVTAGVMFGLGWLSGDVPPGPDREKIDDFTEFLAGLAERTHDG
jgi:hypothetical protein